jgi:Putative lumazine-binding
MSSITTDQQEAVRRPAIEYLTSWYTGDADRMASALHPEMSKRYVRSLGPGLEYLDECGASKVIAWTRSGQGREIPAEYQNHSVTILDHGCTNLAVVKVVGAAGVEYLQVGDFGNRWQIINILGEPRTAAPWALPLHEQPGPPSGGKEPSGDEIEQIRAVGVDYYWGWATRDLAREVGSVHPSVSKKAPQADPTGYVFLRSWPAPKFMWMAAPEWGEDDTKPKGEISILDRANGIASLKVVYGFDANGENPTALDYIDAAKCDGRWQGINIVWREGPMAGYTNHNWDA